MRDRYTSGDGAVQRFRSKRLVRVSMVTGVGGAFIAATLAGPMAGAADTVPMTPTPIDFTVAQTQPTSTPAPTAAAGSTNVSVGTGGNANASADGGEVTVGATGGNVNISADGGNASADASGGDNNSVIIGDGGTLVAQAEIWKGGKYQPEGKVEVREKRSTSQRIEVVETRTYSRACVVVYAPIEGEAEEASRASLEFVLETIPAEPVALRLVGLDDHLEGRSTIAIELNGERVYEGESVFENAKSEAATSAWTRVAFVVTPELLLEGKNQVTLVNLTTSTEIEVQSYVLLAKASIRNADDEVLASAEATSTATPPKGKVAFVVEDKDDKNEDGETTGDKNRGHGNDPDHDDEDNPGQGGGNDKNKDKDKKDEKDD